MSPGTFAEPLSSASIPLEQWVESAASWFETTTSFHHPLGLYSTLTGDGLLQGSFRGAIAQPVSPLSLTAEISESLSKPFSSASLMTIDEFRAGGFEPNRLEPNRFEPNRFEPNRFEPNRFEQEGGRRFGFPAMSSLDSSADRWFVLNGPPSPFPDPSLPDAPQSPFLPLVQIETTEDGIFIALEDGVPAPPTSFGDNPAFDLIGLTALRNDPAFSGIDGSGLAIAVIDTGLDRTHPLLAPNFITGVDFVNGGSNPVDRLGHGTHVSGIAGSADPNIGVAPDAGLIGLQVFESSGFALNSTIEDALEWVLANRETYNIVAVNLSLGGGFFSSEEQADSDILFDDIQRLEAAGVTVVAAGGNSYFGREFENFAAPAIYSTLAVGAVWQDGTFSNVQWGSGAIDFTTGSDRLTSFTQRLDAPNTLFAPGALITSTVPGGGLEALGGTSMASPMVAGAVALLQEAALQFGGRLLSPDEVVDILRSTADAIIDGDDENDNVTNTGLTFPRLDIYSAVQEVERRFGAIAPPPNLPADINGTLAGAILGPRLTGTPVSPLLEAIGTDGGSTTIGATDVDVFRFEVATAGMVFIEVVSNSQNPEDFDSVLRLFDGAGVELAIDDDGGDDLFSRLDTFLEPGTYFVGVSGGGNAGYNPAQAGSGTAGDTGTYGLQFGLTNDDPNGVLTGAVSVNLGTDQEPLTFNGFIGADLGQPVGSADVDLYELVVPDNGILFIDIDTPFETDFVDSHLRLFDKQGRSLFFRDGSPAASDDDLAFDLTGEFTEFTDLAFPGLVFDDPVDRTFFSGHDTDSFLGVLVERGEVYYIGVSDSGNATYDPTTLDGRIGVGSEGSYDLVVTFVNNDLNGSITQANVLETLPVRRQQRILGSDRNPDTGQFLVVGDRDVDFSVITSATAGILEINIDSLAGTSLGDTVDSSIFVFDEDGNLLGADRDTESLDPLLQIPIEANESYFVAVTGAGNDNFDPFLLGSGSPGDEGAYFFSSQVLPLSTLATLSDNGLENAAVQTVRLGDRLAGVVGEDGALVLGGTDVDLYRFVPEASGSVTIQALIQEEFGADTFLRFFDSTGTELAANDNASQETRGSFLNVEVEAGLEYFIGVNGAGPDANAYDPVTGEGAAVGSQGDYTLALDATTESFQVTAVETIPSGVVIGLNRAVDLSALNLYETSASGPIQPDITLVGSNGPVFGSLVWDALDQTLTFLQTGGVLAPDTYTLTLFGGSNGLLDESGTRLDGNGDGVAGGNFVQSFTLSSSSRRVLSLPDFSRGPGQGVDVPAIAPGLGIEIDNGSGVTQVEGTLTYDPTLLTINGAELASGLPDGWRLTTDLTTPGEVRLSLTGTALAAGPRELVVLDAVVPDTAFYGTSQVLAWEAIALNGGAIGVLGDAALQQITLFGDGTGDGSYNTDDAEQIARLATDVDQSFVAFPTTDPRIIGDISGNGSLTGLDAAIVADVVAGIPQDSIPSPV